MKESKRHIFRYFVLFFIIAMLAWMSTKLEASAEAIEPKTDSDGTYLVGTTEELDWIAAKVNAGETGIDVKLTADITATQNLGIGNDLYARDAEDNSYAAVYSGVFDGDGHTITVSISNNAPRYGDAGLFPFTDGATIKNLIVSGSVYGIQRVGSLIGWAKNTTVINCGNEADVELGPNYGLAGGLIGKAEGTIKVSGCYNKGNVFCTLGISPTGMGGLIGYVADGGVNTLDLDLTVENCYNTGTITSYTSYDPTVNPPSGVQYCGLGGLIGTLYAKQTVTLQNLYNQGELVNLWNSEELTDYEYEQMGAIVGCAKFTSNGVFDATSNFYWLENKGTLYGLDGLYAGSRLSLQGKCEDADALRAKADDLGDAFKVNQGCSDEILLLSWETEVPHSFTKYVSDNNPTTCRPSGTETATCDNGCGAIDTKVIGDTLPHKFTNYVSNGDATATTDGTKTAECDYGCGTKDTVTDEGSATAREPKQDENGVYLVGTAGELDWIAETVTRSNATTINVKLTADITAHKNTMIGSKDIRYAGTGKHQFNGTFDGNGKTLTIDITSDEEGPTALFPYIGNATIKNLTVAGSVTMTYQTESDTDYFGTSAFIGTIDFGKMDDEDKIGVVLENCVNKASVYAESHLGGFVGYALSNLTMTNCTNEGDITSGSYGAGGFVAYADDDAVITLSKCVNKGTVQGTSSYIAGIIGQAPATTWEITKVRISDCTNYGDVSGTNYVAGIIASSTMNSDATAEEIIQIVGCSNEGNITGKYAVGGIAAYINNINNPGTTYNIDRCYNTGTITGNNYTASGSAYTYGAIGGILGCSRGAQISNSYNVGTVYSQVGHSQSGAGGIVGKLESNGVQTSVCTNVYNAGKVSTTYSAYTTNYKNIACYGGIVGAGGSTCALTLENAYYLLGSAASSAGGELNGTYGNSAIEITAKNLKSLPTELGDAFKANTNPSYHKGYPILDWETDHEHTFTTYVSDGNATCTEDGTKTAVCDYEGCNTTDTIADEGSKAHKYTDYKSDNNATCTKDGTKTAECIYGCGTTDTITDEGSAKGHTEEVLEAVAPTCTETGLEAGKKCSVCSEILVEQKVIEKIGHTEEDIPKEPATCTKTGLTAGKKCAVCGEILTAQTVIPATGHDFNDWVSVSSPNCTDKGSEQHTCKICQTVETRGIDEKGHSWEENATVDKEATCTEDGSQSVRCSVCGAVKESTVIPAKGHTEKAISGTAATCTKTGLSEGSYCTVCKATLVEQTVLPKLSHQYSSDWTVDTKATTKKAGSQSHHCTVCGKKSDVTAIAKIASVSLATTNYYYDGSAKQPKVTVKDADGKTIAAKYYTVVYKNNTEVGTAKATITFNGNYGGTVTKTFTIKTNTTANKNALNASAKVSMSGKTLTVKWGKVTTADGYDVFVQTASKAFSTKATKTITKNTISSCTISSLSQTGAYKVVVKAYRTINGKKTFVGNTLSYYVVGGSHATATNAKSITVAKTTVELSAGKTSSISATVTNTDKKKELPGYVAELRYRSTNTAVATVDANGKITAVGKGTCTIYVVAENGVNKKVSVTVK